jgi:hypothetical protein
MLGDGKLIAEKLSRLRNQSREMYHRILPPVNNSLIAYPMKQYDKTLSVALSIALDIINEKFTVKNNVESVSQDVTNFFNSFRLLA